jgi:hypothetical protein
VIGSGSRIAVAANNVNYYKTRGKQMRILNVKQHKVFLEDEDEVRFVAYLGSNRVTNRDTLRFLDRAICEQLRQEREEAEQNLSDFYAELRS